MRGKDCISHAPGNLFVGVVVALNERDVDIITEEYNEFLPPCLDEVFFFSSSSSSRITKGFP